jgi:hypothetical protein
LGKALVDTRTPLQEDRILYSDVLISDNKRICSGKDQTYVEPKAYAYFPRNSSSASSRSASLRDISMAICKANWDTLMICVRVREAATPKPGVILYTDGDVSNIF